jgi:hypothetical protein
MPATSAVGGGLGGDDFFLSVEANATTTLPPPH